MSLKDFVLSGVISGVVALAVLFSANLGQSPMAQQPLGAFAGPDVTETMFFRGDAVLGGSNYATSSIGAATYTAGDILRNKTITHTAASALTATLPASTTLQNLVPNTGDTAVRFILPVTTGFTLAGGTGTDLNTASSTKFCVAGQVCRLDFVRKSNSDIEVLLTNPSGN